MVQVLDGAGGFRCGAVMGKGFHTFIFRVAVLALFVFFFVTFASVLLRFVFDAGHVALADLQRYSIGVFVSLGILYAALKNTHVRADLRLFENFRFFESRPGQIAFVVLPCIFLALVFVPVVLLAWQSFEGSSEPEGIGGYFLVKTLFPIALLLIGLNALLMLRHRQKSNYPNEQSRFGNE